MASAFPVWDAYTSKMLFSPSPMVVFNVEAPANKTLCGRNANKDMRTVLQ
jgi:hypothetical protein